MDHPHPRTGRRYDTVSFLSDLGTVGEAAGVVRAVLRDLAPHVAVIDLTHDVAPFDVRAGSLALARAISYLPAGVVLASVDPDAGADRRAVAIEVAGGDGVLVGPDNGLLAPAVAMAGGAGRCVVLDAAEHHLSASPTTFAARDVLAPVAAALCNGTDLADLGTSITPEELMPGIVPLSREEAGVVVCEVLWVDRFGNCQLNVGPDEVAPWGDVLRISVGDPTDPVRRIATRVASYREVGAGAVGLLVDAHGLLSIALDRRSAAEELGIAAGEMVVIGPVDDEDSSGAMAPVTTPVTTPVTLRAPR